MSDLQVFTEEEEKQRLSDIQVFFDQIRRHFNKKFEQETVWELNLFLKSCIREDFDYCLKELLLNNEKYKIDSSDIYKLCAKSRSIREKNKKRLEEVGLSNREKAVEKVDHITFKEAVNMLQRQIKSKKKEEVVEPFNKFRIYEYYDEEGRPLKAIAKGKVDHSEFKKACRYRLYKSPHSIKEIYHKYITVAQEDHKGNVISSYKSLRPVSSNMEGALLYTVGYF